jgi:hypothetical protein
MTRTLYISYRPLRIGFLIRGGSADDLVGAARTNTFLWGGRYNPIIATDDLVAARRLIADFRVDLLHPVTEHADGAQLIAEHEYLAWPREIGSLFAPRGPDNEIEPTVLDIQPALVDSWERTMRHRENSRFRTFTWDEGDELATLFTVWFGQFDGDLGEYYRTVYENRVRAIAAVPRETDFGQHELFGPLAVTGADLEPDLLERTRLGVVVGDPANVAHLTAFWNLRAGGYRVDFYTGDEVLDRGLARHVRNHISRYAERSPYERHIHVFSFGGDELPDGLAAMLGDEAGPLRHDGLHAAWGYREPPALFRTDSHDVFASEDEDGGDRRLIHLPLGEKPFPHARLDLTTQQWVVSVGAPAEGPLEDTLHLPYLPKLNDAYERVTPMIHDVRVEHERIGLIAPAGHNRLLLQPLPATQLISDVFQLAGLTAARSSSGHRAHQIINQLGHLQRCRVFRLPGVRKLVSSRDAHLGVRGGVAVQTINEGFAAAGRFYVSGEHLDTTRKVFRFLLARRVFLASYELECPNCRLASLYSPRALEDDVGCPKCGTTFLLAPAIDRDQWRYQLSGLLGQPEQHVLEEDREERPPEAVGVLLTLVWLHDADVGDDLLLDTNYEIRGEGINGEIDIVAIERRRDGEVSVLLGECRTGGRFSDDDIEKMHAVAERLRAAGVGCHLLFATLRGELSADEIGLFRALRDREQIGDHVLPRPPIIVTRPDLELGDFARRDELEQYYHGELANAAAASNVLYLGGD